MAQMEMSLQAIHVASRLQEESETKQVSTLLYCLRKELEAVLSSTNVTEGERRQYKDVLTKFDAFFQVQKNVIFE